MGHSFAGIALLMLLDRFPQKIDFAVFVASLVLPSGVSLEQDKPLLSLVHTDYYKSTSCCTMIPYNFFSDRFEVP